jgi:hypothetical protein
MNIVGFAPKKKKKKKKKKNFTFSKIFNFKKKLAKILLSLRKM